VDRCRVTIWGDFRRRLDRAASWATAVEGKRPSFFKDLQFLLIGPCGAGRGLSPLSVP